MDKDFLYNSYPHQREGQNILYNDGHVKFEGTPNVGINNDNVYQRWPSSGDLTGSPTASPAHPWYRLSNTSKRAGALATDSSNKYGTAEIIDLVPGDITKCAFG